MKNIVKIAHKINIDNNSNRKYKEFINDFFSNPQNYFKQSCDNQPFCFGKFLTKIDENLTLNDFYWHKQNKSQNKSFFLPLMKKKKLKTKKNNNISHYSEIQVKQQLNRQEIIMLFDRFKTRIEKNKEEEESSKNKKINFLDELNHSLANQENNLTSYLNYQQKTEKLEEKLEKRINRPKSHLLIHSSNIEKFRLKKESRNESNTYFNDKCDKMKFHFDKFLRKDKTFSDHLNKVKSNILYVRKPNIPKPITKLERLNIQKKFSSEIPKPKKKLKRDLSEIVVKGESLLKWERDLIDKMKGKKYILKNRDSKELSRSSTLSYNSKAYSIISSRRSDRMFTNNNNITINENLFG